MGEMGIEMIERVARRLAWLDLLSTDTEEGWAKIGVVYERIYVEDKFVDYARAAIEAMREASFHMLIGGQKVVNLSEEPGRFEFISRDECQEIWEAMIDAALARYTSKEEGNG